MNLEKNHIGHDISSGARRSESILPMSGIEELPVERASEIIERLLDSVRFVDIDSKDDRPCSFEIDRPASRLAVLEIGGDEKKEKIEIPCCEDSDCQNQAKWRAVIAATCIPYDTLIEVREFMEKKIKSSLHRELHND